LTNLGQRDEPLKECKLVIENTNDSLHSLQDEFGKSVDLLKSQQIILQESVNKRTEFMQFPEDKTKTMNYDLGYLSQQLNNDVQFVLDLRNDIAVKLQGRVETSIDYLNRIRDHCLNLDRPRQP
jgi:hypothetical protein